MNSYLPRSIKVILFDHDDTLIGTIESRWAQHKYIARTFYGKELSDDEITKHWGKPFPELICKLYGTDDIQQALAYNRECRDEYPEPLFEGVVSMLQKLKDTGRLTGIVTAASRSDFEQDLDRLHIPRNLIDYSQTADDTPYHKPDPRVFVPVIKWLEERNVNSNEVMYIGDSLDDMNAALGAGFSFTGVETGLTTAGEFQAAGAASLAGIGKIINQIIP